MKAETRSEITRGVQIAPERLKRASGILTPEAIHFVAGLHREFCRPRQRLLSARRDRQERIDRGELPEFLPETKSTREGDWKVASAPRDLEDRKVEITGPVEPKMMIQALNSGARVYMADFEDALSPTWEALILGQECLMKAYRRTLEYDSPDGKKYRLADHTATLVVRPRGWHLPEKHLWIDGEPISASLFDFGLAFFHNAHAALERGTGPYYYLPKLESHLEARLWNDVFNFAQEQLELPRGTIRATVLIETILAAFEMEEILYELREHAAGLNAGRWDYIFSVIKKFRNHPEFILPERSRISMNVPFMRAYTDLLVKTCHRRGAHAIGGMSAFVPSRKDPEANAVAFTKVREDKEREVREGFDGTWVAHPDLVPLALASFERVMDGKPHQKALQKPDVRADVRSLLGFSIAPGVISEKGLRADIEVSVRYLAHWLSGQGAVALHHLMEDAATAEIARSQIWQWIRHGASLDDGRPITPNLYREFRDQELRALEQPPSNIHEAAALLDQLVLAREFPEFLTLAAYEQLD